MNTDWRPRRRDGLTSEAVEEDFLLYDPKQDHVHLLNISASTVWDLCDGTRTPEEITKEIERTVSTRGHDIRKDVEKTLKELHEKGLVE